MREGSGPPFSFLSRPLPLWGRRLYLPMLFFEGNSSAPPPQPPEGLGRARSAPAGTCPQLRAESPYPSSGQDAARRGARSHYKAVLDLLRPLGTVGRLGALDLDVDRGGARFAGSGGCGGSGH